MKKLTSKGNIINISDDSLKLLIYIYDYKYATYLDMEFLSIIDFEKSPASSFMTNSEFKERNTGGTLYLIMELLKYKLVDVDYIGYGSVYILSNYGKQMMNKVIRKIKLEKLCKK